MIFSFLFIYIFVVNIVYYVVHIVCQVDVIANSLVLYLPFCSTLNKNFFSLLSLHSIKFRDKLYMQLKTTQVDTTEYLRLKTKLDNNNKVLKQSIRAAKQAHYYDIFNEHRNDIQKTWTSIKNVLNQGKGNDKFPNVFLIENKMCSDKDLIANTFNEDFTQIGPRLAGNIDVANKRSYESYLGNPCEVELNFTRTTPEEIMEIISKMKPKSNSGLDNISCRLMPSVH